MPNLVIYKKLALTGGGATALDGIDGADLVGNELAFVTVSNILYHYLLNATSGASESSPDIIAPDVNPGNKRWILQGVEGADISDNDSSQTLSTTAFTKSQDAVLHRDPDQGVALTAATSGSSGITVADNDNLDMATNNFMPWYDGLVPDYTPSAGRILLQKWISGVGIELGITVTTGNVYLQLNGVVYTSSTAPTVTDGTRHHIAAIVTVGAVNTTVDFLVDGVALGAQQSAANPGTVSNAAAFYVLGTSTARTAGTVNSVGILNFAPTAAEILDAYRNGIPEAWKWGSQTELMPNQVDRDFSGASAWANVDLNAYDETTDLTITATAANQYCTCPVASAPTTIGKKYRMEFDIANIVSTWTIKSFDGTQTIGTVTANGTDTRIEWTATTTGGYRIVSDSTTSSGDFDNFSLVEIGPTLALLPENIQNDKWYDASSNGLNASYPASGWSLTRPPARRVKQPTPTAKTTAVTLTIAELLTGIITGTHSAGATQAYTLPTGTLCDAWPAFGIDDHFDWILINLSAAAVDTITITAGADHTLVGEGIVQSAHASTGQLYGNSAKFRTRKTATNTFVTYRIG